MTLRFEPHNDPDIDRVWKWFEYQIVLISESRESVVRLINSGSNATSQAPRPHEAQFTGFTPGDVAEFFDTQRGQLELLTMFEILATTEAVLRIEVKTRAAERKKDSLSKRFRNLYKAKGGRLRLDEDILVAMKEEGVSASAIADFRGALNLRNWLAHGRYWNLKAGRGYTPNDGFDISRALLDSMAPS